MLKWREMTRREWTGEAGEGTILFHDGSRPRVATLQVGRDVALAVLDAGGITVQIDQEDGLCLDVPLTGPDSLPKFCNAYLNLQPKMTLRDLFRLGFTVIP